MGASQEFGGYVASVGVALGKGSRHETPETNGVTAVVQSAALAEAQAAMAAIGGSVVAETGREATTYVATVLKEHADEAASILGGILSKPPSRAAFEVAKASALQKISDELPTTKDAIVEDMVQCAYLDTAMGMPVQGTVESVSALTLENAESLVAAAAPPPKVALCGAALSAELLSKFPANAPAPSSVPAPLPPPAVFTGSDKKMYYESHPVARFAFAYEFPSLNTEYAAACRILPYLIGPPASAAAATSLYEPYNSHVKLTRDHAEQDCSDSIEPFYLPFADTALFGVALTAKDVRVEDCMWYTCNNLVRLCFEVSEAELARAKLAFKADVLHSLATPHDVVSAYLHDLRIIGRVVSPPELIQRVADLDLKAVRNLAYTYVHDADHALAAIGPLHELPDYNWVRTASYNYHY